MAIQIEAESRDEVAVPDDAEGAARRVRLIVRGKHLIYLSSEIIGVVASEGRRELQSARKRTAI